MRKVNFLILVIVLFFVLLVFLYFSLFNVGKDVMTEGEVLNVQSVIGNEFKENQVTPWAHDVMGIQQSSKKEISRMIKIAIIDSGINKNHEDLLEKVVGEFNAINPKEPITDEFGHGTAIAGIIAANDNAYGIIGISQNVELYDVKVLNDEGKGDVEHFINAIEWCIEQEVDIINVSFGFQAENLDLKNAIDKANDKGIIIVAAAGNTYGFGVDYPARYENVLSITSIREDLKRASSAAKGKIDFAAPGVDIISTDKDGGYSLFTGTSFATAYATGFIARLLEEKDLTRDELMNVLKELAVDLGVEGYDREYGYGLLKMKNEVE
ncbi:S8 family peptidase [Anaerobacillus isosaccharinicus]|uniref:Peptidase S8 n=1 Tax=Anaerobacillus isosaccharinicus TaxID=1532552 RepID=A0A1S2L569_9BACI|nr:S8 family peptidase [Anaerobacillus isosaccharinicus]MBA5584997.1 S8 family peptidase [Anaerobacillus isosaccharinicus]QOY36649.1 S8 family peptidase [Anaerobacillus isosaccharinicus]